MSQNPIGQAIAFGQCLTPDYTEGPCHCARCDPHRHLKDWLDTVISARKEVAQAAADEGTPTWSVDPVFYAVRDTAGRVVARSHGDRSQSVQHAAANDPETVLRRCARDRKLLELHGARHHDCPVYDDDGDLDQEHFYDHEACPVVILLAESYGWKEV